MWTLRGARKRYGESRFPSVKKVTSSHSKGQTVILTEEDIPEDKLRETIDKTGYTVTSVSAKPYEKKGLFGFRK